MNKFIDMEYPVIYNALTRAEIIRGMDDAGYIEGVISVSLASLVEADYDNFLDLAAEKLIGSVCLSDINYRIVGCSNSDEVLLLVSGHADEVADALEDIPNDIDIKAPERFSFKNRQNPLTGEIVYQAVRINGHGDYHVSWELSADEKRGTDGLAVNGDYYTAKEAQHFINSGYWLLIEPD